MRGAYSRRVEILRFLRFMPDCNVYQSGRTDPESAFQRFLHCSSILDNHRQRFAIRHRYLEVKFVKTFRVQILFRAENLFYPGILRMLTVMSVLFCDLSLILTPDYGLVSLNTTIFRDTAFSFFVILEFMFLLGISHSLRQRTKVQRFLWNLF